MPLSQTLGRIGTNGKGYQQFPMSRKQNAKECLEMGGGKQMLPFKTNLKKVTRKPHGKPFGRHQRHQRKGMCGWVGPASRHFSPTPREMKAEALLVPSTWLWDTQKKYMFRFFTFGAGNITMVSEDTPVHLPCALKGYLMASMARIPWAGKAATWRNGTG